MQEFSIFHSNYRWHVQCLTQTHCVCVCVLGWGAGLITPVASCTKSEHKIAIKITLDAPRDSLIRQTMRSRVEATHIRRDSLCSHSAKGYSAAACSCPALHMLWLFVWFRQRWLHLQLILIALSHCLRHLLHSCGSNQCGPHLINVESAFRVRTTIAWFATVCARLFISLRPHSLPLSRYLPLSLSGIPMHCAQWIIKRFTRIHQARPTLRRLQTAG